MNDTTLCHDTTYNVIQSLCIIYIWLSQDVDVSSWLILMAPFYRELISFLTKSMILVIGLLRVWLLLFESATQSVTPCTSPFLLASTPIILANCHWLCWQYCSFNIKMSPNSKFLLLSFHFCLVYKLCRNSFLHLYQNSSALCCMHFHLLLEYRSGFVKTSGGGMAISVFIVNRLLGESGIWLLVSLKVSTVSGLELIIDSTFAIKVLSVFRFLDYASLSVLYVIHY